MTGFRHEFRCDIGGRPAQLGMSVVRDQNVPLLWWPSGLRCCQLFLGYLWCDPH